MADGSLARRLGTGDAVVVGLGSMLGAGVFAAFAPAAAAAGSRLLLALVVAAVVAAANATASARLAARYPQSGGTYVYGRERLGPFWGYLAGWGFVVGKTASCAAMALTVGAYAWPDHARAVAAVAVVLVTATDLAGIQRSAAVTRVVVAAVLSVLVVFVVALLGAGGPPPLDPGDGPAADPGPGGILRGAGFLFFAFAGYARLATLGEEVRDPARTIPRAVAVALGVTVTVYAAVAVTLLRTLGADGTAVTRTPLVDAAEGRGVGWLVPVIGIAAVVAALGSLLTMVLGVSRTTLAMARDHHLPHGLAAVHPRTSVPHHAGLAVGVVVLLVVLVADVRSAIGFSSVTVLTYYAVANASALTLGGRAVLRAVAVLGLVGCLAVALALPLTSLAAGAAVLLAGAVAYRLRGTRRPRRVSAGGR